MTGLLAEPELLRDVLSRAAPVRAVFQPLVDLDDGAVVGYEALARGPVGTALESPQQLFDAARATGTVPLVDRLCREAAVRGALAAGLGHPHTLFLNVEPQAVVGGLDGLPEVLGAGAGRLGVVLELTERALADRPAELLTLLQTARERGWGVALDDVGSHPDSLTLLPLLAPDVVKLDLRLVQHPLTLADVRVVHAVRAYAEASGATVVAEGIETERHRQTAVTLGARYGQGHLFGRPGPLGVDRGVADGLRYPVVPPGAVEGPSPFDLVSSVRGSRRGTKRLCLAMTRQLEEQAGSLGVPPVLLATFEQHHLLTRSIEARYTALAERMAFVAVFGEGVPARPWRGVRGGDLAVDDPVAAEWDVVVIGAHFAAAFVARDREPARAADPADLERPFDFALTFDRSLALAAARSLVRRLAST